jgi:hypothetical protein
MHPLVRQLWSGERATIAQTSCAKVYQSLYTESNRTKAGRNGDHGRKKRKTTKKKCRGERSPCLGITPPQRCSAVGENAHARFFRHGFI